MDQALGGNPAIRSQEAEMRRQELEKDIARGRHFPKVDLSAGYTRYAHPTLVTPIREVGVFPPLDRDIWNAGVVFSLPLYAGGKLVAGEHLAEHNRQIAAESLRASGQDLLFNVVVTYTKALQFRHLQKALALRIRSLEQEEASITQRLSEGRAAKLDLIRLQTQLSQARHDLLAVEQGERNALALLAALLGRQDKLPPLAEMEPTTVSVPGSREEALARAAVRRPDMLRAQAVGRAAAAQADIARAEQLPQVNLVGKIQTASGSDLKNFDDGQIGVQVVLPLFDGSIRRRRVDQANLERRRGELLEEETRNQLVSEIEQAYGGLTESRSRLDVALQGEREAQEALRIEKLRYGNGESTITDLLGAEAALWGATVSRLQAGYDVAAHQARLLRAMGELSPDSFKPRPAGLVTPGETGAHSAAPPDADRYLAIHRGQPAQF
ncbi:MAG: TolC family protein [Pseudomonadota bacterium]